MHLVGFTIEIYCDALSYKRQTEIQLHEKTDVFAVRHILTDIEGKRGPRRSLVTPRFKNSVDSKTY